MAGGHRHRHQNICDSALQLGLNEVAHEEDVLLVSDGEDKGTVGLEDLAIGVLLDFTSFGV